VKSHDENTNPNVEAGPYCGKGKIDQCPSSILRAQWLAANLRAAHQYAGRDKRDQQHEHAHAAKPPFGRARASIKYAHTDHPHNEVCHINNP
jgi:hypothetical protein